MLESRKPVNQSKNKIKMPTKPNWSPALCMHGLWKPRQWPWQTCDNTAMCHISTTCFRKPTWSIRYITADLQTCVPKDTSMGHQDCSMAELEVARAKAMENTQHLRSSTDCDVVSMDNTAHVTQALPQAIHLDIAPMVQRTDISLMRSSNPVPGQPGNLSMSNQGGTEHPSAVFPHDGVPQCTPAGRARRSSIFQQTATGIKTMLQLATGANQVAPALFEEVRLESNLHVVCHCAVWHSNSKICT